MATIEKTDPNLCEVCRTKDAAFEITFLDDAIATDVPGLEAPVQALCCLDCRNNFERAGRVFTSEFYTPKTETLEVTSEPTEQPAEGPSAADA